MRTVLRLATRGSALALWQAHWVADKLRGAGVEVEIRVIKTAGDVRQDVPLSAMLGRGVFVTEIENALLSGAADIAVHSAKDLPSGETPGLTLAAFGARADARDALVSPHGAFAQLPANARVATSAPRRTAQLKRVRPDLRFTEIRGNVDTRLRKLAAGEADALILACAGLDRLELSDRIAERLPLEISLPQVGQASVAVQCRADDIRTIAAVAVCDHRPTHDAVMTERAFLSLIGAGCTAPVAAHCLPFDDYGISRLTARVLSGDGVQLREAAQIGEPGAKLAERVYNELIAQGAAELLNERA